MTTVERMQKNLESMLDSAMFGEPIVYIDKDGIRKSIRAFVYRKNMTSQAQKFSGSSGNVVMQYDIEIQISNSALKGMPAITEKSDTVELSIKQNGTTSTVRVMAILSQDPAAWHLGLKA